jgi:peptidoglycan/xylan/chitin deacetylase (PgdA/CDA1 family)
MSEEMLHVAARQGIEIGSHGWHHKHLLECSDDELHEEIFSSRQQLREMGFDADFFAYPYGEFSTRIYHLLQKAGYLSATSIFSNEPTVTSNPFAMRRVYVHENDNQVSFRIKLMPLYQRYKAWRGCKSLNVQARTSSVH